MKAAWHLSLQRHVCYLVANQSHHVPRSQDQESVEPQVKTPEDSHGDSVKAETSAEVEALGLDDCFFQVSMQLSGLN